MMSADDQDEPMVDKDEVQVTLSLKWSEGAPPQKCKVELQRVFTVWANKSGFRGEFDVEKVSEDGRAVIKIKPAPGVTELLKLCGKPLTRKDGQTVTIVSVSLSSPESETQVPEDVKMSASSGSNVPPSSVSEPQDDKDEVHVTLSVKWSEGAPPQKCKVELQRVLTVWANKSGFGGELDVEKVSEDGRAVIKIKPAPGVTELLKLCDKPLTRKDGKTVTIVSVSVTPPELETRIPDNASLDLPPSFASHPQHVKGRLSEQSSDMTACNIPMHHYWYVNQAYKEEIKRIEEDSGVKIMAEVKLTFEADQRNGDPNYAFSEFINLVQKCSAESRGFTVPLKKVNPEELKDALTIIQRSKNKLLLTLSSEEMTVCGPRQSQDAIRKSLNATQKAINTYTSAGESTWVSQDTLLNIGTSIRDPLVDAGSTMEESSRKLMATSINKFGVDFKRLGTSQGKVGDRAHYKRSGGIQYQKTATSPMFIGSPWFSGSPKKLSHLHPSNLYPSERASSGPVLHKQSGYSTRNTKAPTGKGATAGDDEYEECPICKDTFTNKKQLKCKHEFCEECLARSEKAFGPTCPVCKDVFGKIEGDQPDGQMTWKSYSSPLPGFPDCGHIVISYHIPSGRQTEKHPHPGKYYSGINRTAYLPDNREGREVLHLLKKAFGQKLIFTVGTSRTTGLDDQVIWNDVHHKTSHSGGPENFGYPDPDYLSRVKDQLKAKGIK